MVYTYSVKKKHLQFAAHAYPMEDSMITPDGKWQLTENGWLCILSDPKQTPDGLWLFENGEFKNLNHASDQAIEDSLTLRKDLAQSTSSQPLLSTSDSVIMGDINAQVNIQQGPSLNDIKNAVLTIMNQIGVGLHGTPSQITDQQKSMLTQSIQFFDEIASTGADVDLQTELLVANAAKLSGDYENALSRLEKIIENHPHTPEFDDAIKMTIQLLNRMNRIDTALSYVQKAEQYFDLSSNHAGLGNVFLMKGTLFAKKKKSNEAYAFFEKAEELANQHNLISLQIRSTTNMGLLKMNLNDSDGAIRLLNEGLVLARSSQDHASIRTIQKALADIYKEKGDMETSMRLMREARRGNTDTDDQFILANNHLEDGKNHHRRRNYDIAKSNYLKAKVIFEKIQSNKGLGEVYINLGELYEDLGKINFSYTYFQQALDCFDVTEQENRLHCLTSLGSLCIENKEYSSGLVYTETGFELAEVLLDHELQMSNYINHGIILANLGERLRAKEFFNKANRIGTNHSLDISGIPTL